MKLTPFAKLFVTVVVLGVLGYAFWHYKGDTVRRWAGADKGAATSDKASGVDATDFAALKNAPPDAERGKGAEGVAGAALARSGKLGRTLVVGINTWAGHAPGVGLGEEVRPRREVRPPRGPGGQARGVPQGGRRDHVDHGRQLGAGGVDP